MSAVKNISVYRPMQVSVNRRWMINMISWRKEILRWLYPPHCPVCGDIIHIIEEAEQIGWGNSSLNKQRKDMLLCTACKGTFYQIQPPVCCLCGRIVKQGEEFCINCQSRQFSYIRGFPVWVYNQPMKRSIAAFKYHGRQEYAAYYGQEFVRIYKERLKRLSIQALIPVPMYITKQKARGYNQAELFAKEIGIRLGIYVCSDYLLRVKNTKPQKLLNDKQRYANLQRAFAINEEKKEQYAGLKRVLLVDDIYTTGSTVEMCTKVLLQAGIEKVYAASVSIGGN